MIPLSFNMAQSRKILINICIDLQCFWDDINKAVSTLIWLFSQTHYSGPCVFRLPISTLMIVSISFTLNYLILSSCHIITIISTIIQSEVRTISHCLQLGHETMVCVFCLAIPLRFSQTEAEGLVSVPNVPHWDTQILISACTEEMQIWNDILMRWINDTLPWHREDLGRHEWYLNETYGWQAPLG